MKNIAILGSTGSIGRQTVDVALAHPELFSVSVLAANASDELLEKQIEALSPELAVLADEAAAARLKARYGGKTRIEGGRAAFIEAAAYPAADIVVTSMMGFAGLAPTMKALEAKKDIALANKETLVVAGELVMAKAREMGAAILPVDSEHSALFQCLQGEEARCVERIILTASGGPFRGKTQDALKKATVEECLAHPTWQMGQKITIDSATMMNKGFEVIEAKWLFGVEPEKIQVLVHPQSIIHSAVQFEDGSVKAQLGLPDMRLPIQYAFSYPDRLPLNGPRLNFFAQPLEFFEPDMRKFRCLQLAFDAIKRGGNMPCIPNAANEVVNEAFRADRIGFLDMPRIIEETMQKVTFDAAPSLDTYLQTDAEARQKASELVAQLR